jgi:hypothetical protein
VLVVRVAQLLLRDAGLAAQPDRGRLPHPERQPGEGRPTEQMVVIGVRREQRRDREAGLVEQGRQRVQFVREVGRVDQHRLVAGTNRRARGLPDPAGDDDGVPVDADGPHG